MKARKWRIRVRVAGIRFTLDVYKNGRNNLHSVQIAERGCGLE